MLYPEAHAFTFSKYFISILNIYMYILLLINKIKIERSDVCMILIDAKGGMEKQDVNIFQLAQKNKKKS